LFPDGRTLASGGKDGSVCLWDAARVRGEPEPVRVIGQGLSQWWFDREGRGIVGVESGGRLTRWPEAETGEPLSSVELGRSLVPHVSRYQPSDHTRRWLYALSDDGERFAFGSTNGVVDVWDLVPPRRSWQVTVSTGAVSALAFLDQGKSLLLARHEDGAISKWDLGSSQPSRAYVRPLPADVSAWTVTPNGTLALALGYHGDGWLLDLTTGAHRDLKLEVEQVEGAALSFDGKRIAVASGLGVAKLYNTATGRKLTTLGGFLMGVHSVAFSSDGRRLAVGSSGAQSIKLWDTESYQELLTLQTPAAILRVTAFSPDGQAIGTMRLVGGVVYLWRAPSWAEIEAAEKTDDGSAR
jgi:WD40 repeat protein